jgi:F-type H+-transporting ATPase subunit epsilon
MAFNLQIIAVDRVFFEGEVDKIILKGTEGELAVLPHHTPLTTTLAEGEIKIFLEDKTKKSASLMGGFVKIGKDKTVILTEAAEWPGEIDVDRALAAKERAEKMLKDSNANQARAMAALRRALVRLDLTEK